MKLVLASHNPGKLREIRSLLPSDFTIVPQAELNIVEAEEPHATFVENALAKARHASLAAALPALADDSGLCVAALGGEPGVHSAYYAGREGRREERDARNNRKLLTELRNERAAYYYCIMVLVQHAEDPRPLIAEGLWHGEIARAPRCNNGFGYDPLFRVAGLDKTAAELAPAEKNRISHRAIALRNLLSRLDDADRR